MLASQAIDFVNLLVACLTRDIAESRFAILLIMVLFLNLVNALNYLFVNGRRVPGLKDNLTLDDMERLLFAANGAHPVCIN